MLVEEKIRCNPNDTKLYKFRYKRHGNTFKSSVFLRLGQPSTLIRHENTLFKPEEFENFDFPFSCGRKTFENGTCRER